MAMHMQTRSMAAARPARASRVVVRASAQTSRVLSGFLAGAATLSLSVAPVFAAATPVNLYDDRKAKETGFDLIYEARELDLPQSARDGMTQARGDLSATKERVALSEKRIDNELGPSIEKNYWTEARENLRGQVGNLRFDLNTLADTKPKADKKKALELKKDFIAKVEALDLSLRAKDQAKSLANLTSTQAALDAVLAAVL